jgi:hypothetical protein
MVVAGQVREGMVSQLADGGTIDPDSGERRLNSAQSAKPRFSVLHRDGQELPVNRRRRKRVQGRGDHCLQ